MNDGRVIEIEKSKKGYDELFCGEKIQGFLVFSGDRSFFEPLFKILLHPFICVPFILSLRELLNPECL